MRARHNHVDIDRSTLLVSKNLVGFHRPRVLTSGDAPAERTAKAYALRLRQIRLVLTESIFGLLTVLDVGRRPIPFDDFSGPVAQRFDSKQKPPIFAVEALEPSFHLALRAGIPCLAPHPLQVCHIVRMNYASPSLQSAFDRETGVIERRLIKELGPAIGSRAPYQGRDRVDHQSKAVFGFLDFLERPLQ